jgi:hypothetical protein
MGKPTVRRLSRLDREASEVVIWLFVPDLYYEEFLTTHQ